MRTPRHARPPAAEFARVPGLFRRWELSQVIEVGTEFHVEEAVPAADGTQLFVLYRRPAADQQAR